MYRVLLVDDREIFLMEMKRMKVWGKISGFEAAGTAQNGKQALELLRTESYDLVLTDIRMPVIDGLQLLRRIRQEKLCRCVVLLSEYSEFRYARQGIVLGAFDYLVKPMDANALLDLFSRARSFLDSVNRGDASAKAEIDSGLGAYPADAEKRILAGIQRRKSDALYLFCSTVKNLYNVMEEDVIRADLIVRRLYSNVVEATFARFPWLHNYISIRSFDATDYPSEEGDDAYHDFYCGKITFLLGFIRKYLPETEDSTVGEICIYVLSHPEEDLKLKALAQKFYINHTYLSSIFAVKTGIHFNDYLTQVKMARAEYLFLNTKLKIYDVCYQLGYRDINYFSRRFRKYCGKSPTEYRGLENPAGQNDENGKGT